MLDEEGGEKALHAMQTGVEMMMQKGHKETLPKHLRVGVNSAMIDSAAVASLLIEKGVFTEEEYYERLGDFAERDAASYAAMVNEAFGTDDRITLG